jgi:hypothetical protein
LLCFEGVPPPPSPLMELVKVLRTVSPAAFRSVINSSTELCSLNWSAESHPQITDLTVRSLHMPPANARSGHSNQLSRRKYVVEGRGWESRSITEVLCLLLSVKSAP